MSDVLPLSGQTRRLVLHGARGAVSRCRNFSREALSDWQWTPAEDEAGQEVVDDVLLLVSEVVTNACLHADGPKELALTFAGDRLRIEVTDGSPVPPHPRPSGVGVPGGHGLIVVQRLALRWGSVPREGGKTVWLEVAAPPRLHRRGPGR
ncbi:ATP-binding protein [Streptomyces sp. ISL-98]|uniref:ATP-binding protein n=1 Tax=Streptomyces sp. ISL-98 TaxID=2819192 RepID=UPI001BE5BD9C|nr:ATP-binding protein [Streptomyces sp. ISL-98]MBT2510404.1 ATP-binding protein [Streptomyces sp. ISL-98]